MNIIYIIVFIIGFFFCLLAQYFLFGNPKANFEKINSLKNNLALTELEVKKSLAHTEQLEWSITMYKESCEKYKKTISDLEEACEKLMSALDKHSKYK